MEPYSRSGELNPKRSLSTWGVRINLSRPILRDCPKWVWHKRRQERWYWRGLVIWNPDAEQFIQLNALFALALLEDMRANRDWQERGISIGEVVYSMDPTEPIPNTYPLPATVANAPMAPPLGNNPKLLSPMHLTAEQARVVYGLLVEHEMHLRGIRTEDFFTVMDNLRDTMKSFAQRHLRGQAKTIDLRARDFPWLYTAETNSFTCVQAADRGLVTFIEDPPHWKGRMERPNREVQESDACRNLDEALTWVEEELRAAAQAAQTEWDTLSADDHTRLRPYRIDPGALKPTHITYRALLRLCHVPIKPKASLQATAEDTQPPPAYPTELQIELTFHLPADQVQITREGAGVYVVRSVTSYADETSARAEAERLWEVSTLASARWGEKVRWAYFGVEEAETEYVMIIGGKGNWAPGPDRTTYMAQRAFELTLIHALDVANCRAAFGITEKRMSDEELLRAMHRQRAESDAIPEPARAESRQWLHEQGAKSEPAARQARSVQRKRH